MSKMQVDLRFSVTIDDSEHWSESHLAACEADNPASYDDWVRDQLDEVMRHAGNQFIRNNPSLFASPELI